MNTVDQVSEVAQNRYWVTQSFSEDTSASVPFSFIYGGQSSSEFLTCWQRSVTEKDLGEGKLERTLTLTDPETGLEVKAVITIYTDTPGVDWTLYFTNTGNADTPIIEHVHALDLALPITADTVVVFHGMHGCYPHSFLPYDKRLGCGESVALETIEGRTSLKDLPFFNLDVGDGGVLVGVGWSGQWHGSVARAAENDRVTVQAGMEFMHLRLHPGETIRSPRILALHYKGEEARSYNLFRRTMFAHIMPRANGKLVVPPIAHLSTSFL